MDLQALMQPGVFEWWLTRLDGSRESLPTASVLPVGEGDLRRLKRVDIDRVLQPTIVTFYDAGQMAMANESDGGGGRTGILLALLGAMLIGEQVLAYFGSYHPPARARA